MAKTFTFEIRETLQFVSTADMPPRHKRVLTELLTAALRDTATRARAVTPLYSCGRWEQHEIDMIATHLKGRTARNRQHADEVAIRLAALLHRSPDDIRKKATELGLAAGVDYLAAMSLPPAEESFPRD